ncbi:MAG: CAP domain-containing protein [Candidatus Saccharimonadales bacterium]
MANRHNSNHHIHAARVILLGVLLVAVSVVRIDAHAIPGLTKPAVLAYATSMSRGDLHAAANASRAANGLGAFSLNGQLNNSAQAKAQHMADNNYWAHVAPDGTQPWYFFEAAGYSYRKAGENLAYGFSTSYGANDGWMNSPSHRANILGDYIDVGYGIVNSPNFQGGENTIVVAHYGTHSSYAPPAPAPTPTPAPTPVAPTSTPTPTAPASDDPTPITETTQNTEEKTPISSPTEAQQEATDEPSKPDAQEAGAPITVGIAKNVSVLETIRTGTIPGVAAASLVLTMITAFGYALSHRALVRHAFATGEHFVISHPTFDALALFLALMLILTTTAARLQ